MSDDPENVTGSATGSYAIHFATSVQLRHWGQLPEDHPIFPIVGRVASGWAHLEHVLDLIIWKLAETNDIHGACITSAIMGAASRYDVIKALATVRNLSKETIDKINSQKNAIYEPQERRNRIIHDPWYIDKKTAEVAQFKSMPRKDLRYGIKLVDADYIDKTLKMIDERFTEADKLRARILDELAASQEKQP
jgi:hypothetical protein